MIWSLDSGELPHCNWREPYKDPRYLASKPT